MPDDYYDLGSYSLKITAASDAAQTWFDRGLMWCYGFNHDEAIACFRKALGHDPGCAMAHWGIAYAGGPNYNKAWEAFDEVDLAQCLKLTHEAIGRASASASGAAAWERALIEALERRCASSELGEDLDAWNDAYAQEMRSVYQRFGASPDIATLYAESMMNRTPWLLWDLKTGEVAEGADTTRIIEVLDKAMAENESANLPAHPGLNHMYIHVWEMSPTPERALKPADQLRGLAPDCGHLQHMPTHIDVLCGHYQAVVEWNSAAIVADRKFLEREGPVNFYAFYRCHNYHFKTYGAMFLGQFEPAMQAAREMVETLPEELLELQSPPMADWLEAFVPTEMHVLIRFGRWQDIIDRPLPENQELFSFTTAVMHYAKAVAHAASGDVAAAEAEAELFEAATARVQDTRRLLNNTCEDVLAVAREMMAGEIAYRKGGFDAAFEHLRRSVDLDDNLPYDEPWGWMQPARHALGALLLEQGRVAEAADVYRADLGLDDTLSRACQHPDNVWSLHGYHECLTRLGRLEETHMIKQRLDLANARTDVPVTASCFCRMASG